MSVQTKGRRLLAVYDVNGIQEYIFASERMRENAGASQIVGKALHEFLQQAMKDTLEESTFRAEEANAAASDTYGENFAFLHGQLRAEVVYSGGGKAIVAFRDENTYDAVTCGLARLLLLQGQGLELQTAFVECQGDGRSFSEDMMALDKALQDSKKQQKVFLPYCALPIEEQENGSHLPIVEAKTSPDGVKWELTRPQLQKRAAFDDKMTNRAKSIFHPRKYELPCDWVFAREMEDLIEGRGEDAYIAVVHIDGNGMGDYIQNFKREKLSGSSYAQAVAAMRKLSHEITDINQSLFARFVRAAYCVEKQKVKPTSKEAPAKGTENNKEIQGEILTLPIRPLIIEGDDVTFLCKASWALPLAADFLQNILAKSPDKSDAPSTHLGCFSACAGIALVHSHYPFSVAYEIAESCCGLAKQARLNRMNELGKEKGDYGYIQYTLVRGSDTSAADMAAINRCLLVKRKAVKGEENLSRADSFDSLRNIIVACKKASAGDGSAWSHSRLKDLYRSYAAGEKDLSAHLQANESRGCKLSDLIGENGDKLLPAALELMELFDSDLDAKLEELQDDENGCTYN